MNAIRKEGECRYCGAPVLFIKACNGKTFVCNKESTYILRDMKGEVYIAGDGRLIWGFEVGDAYDGPGAEPIQVYIPHKAECPGRTGGRRRKR